MRFRAGFHPSDTTDSRCQRYPGNMTAIFERIKNAQNLIRVEILRYHRTAGAKYAMIGEKYHPPFDTGKTPQIYNVFEENNIKNLIV